MSRRRPTLKSPCVADRYHVMHERIAEVAFPDGAGCLISLRTQANGTNLVEVYRADDSIRVLTRDELHENNVDLLTALEALTDWGREHTSPLQPNSPHELLVQAAAAVAKAKGGQS